MGAHELAFVGLAGSGLGTVLSMPMVWPRTPRSLDVRLLGTAVLLMSVITALISARLVGLAPATASIEHIINLVGLCAFPLLVLYTRYAAELTVTHRVVGWCLAPAAIYTALVLGRTALGGDTRVSFVWMLPVVLSFTIVSAATLWRAGARRRAGMVPAEWVVAFVAVVNIAQILRMQFGHVPPVRAVVPITLSLGFVAMAAFAVWRTLSSATEETPLVSSPRYERSGLDEARVPDLLRRIDQALSRDRLFARADLTLGDLASAVGLTPHQVSEVLNRHARVSFNDLINRRRVDDVKAQLADPASERYTIEGIGASAGFGSRSALYAAFRRFEATTPTAYRTSRRPK